jgi:ferredoxin
VEEDYCIGCGACETVCPTRPDRAILVEGRAVQDRARLRSLRPGDLGDIQAAPVGAAGPEGAAEPPPSLPAPDEGFPF